MRIRVSRWLLFIHIAGVAFWLGSLVSMFVLIRKGVATENAEARAIVHRTTRSVVRGIINPCAALVLLSGIIMLVQLGLTGQSKPFWLAFMERFGGLVALISVGLLTWQLRMVDRAHDPQHRARGLRRLNQMMMGVGAGVTVTILVVTLRLT